MAANQKIPQQKIIEILGVCRTTLFKLRRDGKLKAYTLPGSSKVYYDEEEVRNLFSIKEMN